MVAQKCTTPAQNFVPVVLPVRFSSSPWKVMNSFRDEGLYMAQSSFITTRSIYDKTTHNRIWHSFLVVLLKKENILVSYHYLSSLYTVPFSANMEYHHTFKPHQALQAILDSVME
jgi:hypothetical protein